MRAKEIRVRRANERTCIWLQTSGEDIFIVYKRNWLKLNHPELINLYSLMLTVSRPFCRLRQLTQIQCCSIYRMYLKIKKIITIRVPSNSIRKAVRSLIEKLSVILSNPTESFLVYSYKGQVGLSSKTISSCKYMWLCINKIKKCLYSI